MLFLFLSVITIHYFIDTESVIHFQGKFFIITRRENFVFSGNLGNPSVVRPLGV